jgi:hypothetical protein
MFNYPKWVTLIIYFMGLISLQANIIRVPADQSTIQGGIDAAVNGDTVLVYPGIYYENINFRDKKIVITSRYFENGDLDYIQSTIINGSQPVHADTASCVLIIQHQDSTAVLQGFTLTGGKGTAWLDEHGAGRYCEGGGILIALSSPTIRYNLIIDNEATNMTGLASAGGGGIRAGDGNPKILNNVITRNKGRYGAGIVLNWTGALVKNNIVSDNSGGQDYGGGALWMNHDGPAAKIIENNTFARNKTVAVYVWQGSSIIRNSIIWMDSSVSAVQIGVRTGGPTVTYSNVQGGWTGIGNIFNNPQFADTSFHLDDNSPCVDAGDTSAIFNDPEDTLSPGTAGLPSCGGLRNDMGAYGGPGAGPLANFISPTRMGSQDLLCPNKIQLEQNYPNPFNPSTTISYTIPKRMFVSLKIFDILGREIEFLVREYQQAGLHKIKYKGDNINSGIYFLVLQADDITIAEKISFIK